MQIHFCLYVSLCWALLVACQTATTPTPAPAAPPQPTVEPTISIPSPATAIPATATAWPTPTAQPPPAGPTWHRPDPAAYVPVFNQLYANVSPLDAPQVDKLAFEQFLQRDQELYFADGWPAAVNFFTTPPAEPLQMPTRDNLLTDIVIQGFLTYLQQEKIDLNQQTSVQTEASQATFTPVDLKGDGSPQWVVELQNDYLYSVNKTGLLMVISPDKTGGYQVDKLLWSEYFPPEDYQIFITDVTGSPAADLLIFMTWYMGLGQPELLLVYSAEDVEINLVEVIELSSPQYHQVAYDLETDVTGDNRPDIQVFYPLELNFDCVQEKIVTYSWAVNSVETHIEEKPAEDRAECNLIWGMVLQDPVLLEKSLAQLEGNNDPAAADLHAINLIHLGMAYYGQGAETLAQEIFAEIAELPAGDVAELAQRAYQHAPHDPLEMCRYLTTHAQEAITSELVGSLVESAVFNPSFMGNSEKIYQPYICPLEATANTLLHQNPLAAAENPVTQLTNLGFKVSWSQEAQLNNSPALEWVIVTEEILENFLVLEPITDTWQLNPYPLYEGEFQTFELTTKDVTGDGVEDIFGLLTTSVCLYNPVEPYTKVVMFYTSENKFYSETNDCSPVGEPTPDQFYSPELPEWQQVGVLAEKYQIELSGHPPMLFLDYMHSLARLSLEGKLPAGVIDDTIAQFPKNEPAVDPYRAQLLFMQGYQHEQQGETDKALIYYLALINSYPTNLWSLLAQTRVFIP